MFWTVDDVFGRAMLCDRCALLATNMASLDCIRTPFESMQEALVVINALAAAAGADALEIAHSELGECGQCGLTVMESPATAG